MTERMLPPDSRIRTLERTACTSPVVVALPEAMALVDYLTMDLRDAMLRVKRPTNALLGSVVARQRAIADVRYRRARLREGTAELEALKQAAEST